MKLVVRLLVAVCVLVVAPAANAHHSITYSLVGTAGTNGWYRSNVTVQWAISQPVDSSSGCEPGTLVSAEGASTRTCSATAGDHTVTLGVTVRIDKTAPTVTGATPGRGPDANGWYNRAVAVAFAGTDAVSGISSCATPTYAGGDGAAVSVAGTCTDVAGNVSAPGAFGLKYDATPPSASVAAARGPDSNGWYNHAVDVGATGTDATSGIASCSGSTYSGPDSASAATGATCVDNAGNTSAVATFGLKYDATPPSVSAKTDRAPTGGWFRKPLTVSFAGSDATSGIASCTAPTLYKGPDGPAASVKGSCVDAAGNAAEAAQSFRYDATAPKLAKPKVEPGKHLVRISWARPPDFASARIVRKPGLKGRKSSVVYRGRAASFADRSVVDGVRYRYELTVTDVAGNLSGRAVTASSRGALYRPAPGARVRAPLTLAWDAAAGVTFYNVQVYREGVKVLSAWPAKPTLRLRRSWRYAGKTQRLVAGTYVWYVWPAQGTLARPTFGRQLGKSSFVVKGGA